MEDELSIAYDLIYLLKCALNNKKADLQKVLSMDLKGLLSLANAHQLTACAAFALENIGLSDEEYYPWQQAKSMSVRKNLLLNNERSIIYAYMEENQILHTSLKEIFFRLKSGLFKPFSSVFEKFGQFLVN